MAEISEPLTQPCQACQALTLDALLKSPSISLKCNYTRMEPQEWIEALLLAYRTTLYVDQIQEACSQCPVCKIIHAQLEEGSRKGRNHLLVYTSKDLEGGLQSFWLYYPDFDSKAKPAAKITLLADEGMYLYCVRMTPAVDFEVIEIGKADLGQ